MNDRGGRFYECLHQIWVILRNVLKTQQQTCLHNYYLFPHPRCEHLLWLCWSLIPKHHHIHNHHLEEICHSNPIVPRKQSQTKDLHSNQFHSASFKDAKNYSLINPTQTSVLYQIIKVIPAQVCYDNGHIYLTVGCDSLIAVVCWTSNISSTRASQAQLCVCVVFTHLLCSRLTLLSKQLFDWKKFDLLLFSPLQRHFSPVW